MFDLTGITKAQVGLSAADNTSDAGKPVSTAQQTALDLKANLAGADFSGAISLPTAGGTALDLDFYEENFMKFFKMEKSGIPIILGALMNGRI